MRQANQVYHTPPETESARRRSAVKSPASALSRATQITRMPISRRSIFVSQSCAPAVYLWQVALKCSVTCPLWPGYRYRLQPVRAMRLRRILTGTKRPLSEAPAPHREKQGRGVHSVVRLVKVLFRHQPATSVANRRMSHRRKLALNQAGGPPI